MSSRLKAFITLVRVFAVLAALCMLAGGCASLPTNYHREPSQAWDRPQETKLGRSLAPAVEQHSGMSGFLLLWNGMDAFVTRMALAEAAERTLDLQYFIFRGDFTGKLIIDSIIRAAERGVRVRILIDDTTAKGRDEVIAALASQPLIEVRIFNPAAGRSSVSWLVSAAADFDRINRRMHNKMFVADNQAGIVGGRNIGDEYFAAQKEVNFADMDLLAVGPVVQELSRSFDDYWNSEWAYPIEALKGDAVDSEFAVRGRKELAAHTVTARDSEYAQRLRESDFLQKLLDRELPLVWAQAKVFSDRPEKIAGAEKPPENVKMAPRLRAIAEAAIREMLISSPYFIPGKEGIKFFDHLRKKGVRVRIVTNSFAGNDVALVHSGYARYRKDLLKLGVELYELKPSFAVTSEKVKRFGSSGASLHAKTFIIDREKVFVGSLNLDPRSVNLNTEVGILVESRELAETLAKLLDEIVLLKYSYRLTLDSPDENIVWTSEENGVEIKHTQDPEVGFWRRFSTWFLSILAPESLL